MRNRVVQRGNRVLQLVYWEFARFAAAGQVVVGQRRSPHQRCPCLIVVGVLDGDAAGFAHRYHQRFGNALGQRAVAFAGQIAFERVHHNIDNAAAGLEFGNGEGVFRIEEGDERAHGFRCDTLLDPRGQQVVCDNIGV